jgi:hypothetical protein
MQVSVLLYSKSAVTFGHLHVAVGLYDVVRELRSRGGEERRRGGGEGSATVERGRAGPRSTVDGDRVRDGNSGEIPDPGDELEDVALQPGSLRPLRGSQG